MNVIDIILKEQHIQYETEYKFCKDRKWRFDYFLQDWKIGIEFEGGTWVNGGHVRGKKYAKDCEKYNRALCLGFHVLRYTIDMLEKNPWQLIQDIKEIVLLRYGFNITEA